MITSKAVFALLLNICTPAMQNGTNEYAECYTYEWDTYSTIHECLNGSVERNLDMLPMMRRENDGEYYSFQCVRV